MIRTTTPGAPCWLDIGSPDLAATSAFYGRVLGWEFEPAGPVEETGGYGFYKLGGKTVAAGGPLMEEGAASGWIVYFNTPDADATAKGAEAAGGTVRVEPMDVMEAGRMAQLTDPAGARFAVWQAGSTTGVETVDTPGALTWVELYTSDADAAMAFYQTLFDWGSSTVPIDKDMDYHMLTSGGDDPATHAHGGLMELPAEQLNNGRSYWSPVFAVDDCDAAAARVGEAGGTIQMAPMDMPDGRAATFLDPFGASFSVFTSAPAAG